MVSLDDFVAWYPEFAQTDSGLLARSLAEAEVETSPDLLGDKRDTVVALRCAARLAESPQGRAARLSDAKGSIYQVRLGDILVGSACANNRIG